jgi:dihydroorotate dehydrogenase electron transfer subunit
MLWLPGIDQQPFSVSSDNGRQFSLTVFRRGPLTTKLFYLKSGDSAGIAGPYGTSYSQNKNTHYILVAGGYGAAPLANLAEKISRLPGVSADFCLGAKEKKLLLFEQRIKKTGNTVLHITTDDGSAGSKGLVTDNLPALIEKNRQKTILICTCGPELMEKKVLDICNRYNAPCEISIERQMKCGFGVCGQCAVDDPGICMCVDGPVVKRELANQIKEFGNYHRDKSGKKINH